MGINGFQLRRHLSLTAYRVHAFSLHITFQLVAMQLAAAISAFCLPLMILDKALPLLGFSPVIKVGSCQTWAASRILPSTP